MFIERRDSAAKLAPQAAHLSVLEPAGSTGLAHFIAMEYIGGKDCSRSRNRAPQDQAAEAFLVAMECFIIAKVRDGARLTRHRNGSTGAVEIRHAIDSPQTVLCSYEGRGQG